MSVSGGEIVLQWYFVWNFAILTKKLEIHSWGWVQEEYIRLGGKRQHHLLKPLTQEVLILKRLHSRQANHAFNPFNKIQTLGGGWGNAVSSYLSYPVCQLTDWSVPPQFPTSGGRGSTGGDAPTSHSTVPIMDCAISGSASSMSSCCNSVSHIHDQETWRKHKSAVLWYKKIRSDHINSAWASC